MVEYPVRYQISFRVFFSRKSMDELPRQFAWLGDSVRDSGPASLHGSQVHNRLIRLDLVIFSPVSGWISKLITGRILNISIIIYALEYLTNNARK